MKQIVFVANHQPPLKDGLYSLSLHHQLKYGQDKDSLDSSYSSSKHHYFAVAGDRFSLKDNVIHKLYPPANGEGHFDNVLPHVVLNRRTLPWERSPDSTTLNSSWLAILIFNSNMAPAAVLGKLADLYPDTIADSGGLLPHDIYSYGSTLKVQDHFLGYGESASDSCIYIDIPQMQFAAIAPSLNDLGWNAHARTLEDKDGNVKEFAVVAGNCLPVSGNTCIAHLVSLENLGGALPQDDGSYVEQPWWKDVRVVSLKSWSFYVSPLEASFSNILQGLNGGVDRTVTELADSQLRLPAGYIPLVAKDSNLPVLPLSSGYTVLGGVDADSGAPAWYRGPFLPSNITPLPADQTWKSHLLPANAASQLVAQVETTPSDDISLAAAWQLGRLLALADQTFATAQVSWKRDVRLALNTKLGQENKLNGGSRASYAKQVREVIANEEKIRSLLGDVLAVEPSEGKLSIPQQLVDWLGRLAMLTNVPVNYLIADMQMLPQESIKFFNIDPRWLACLLDGAWSLDRQPAKQWAFDTAYEPWKQILNGTLKTSYAPALNNWPVSGAILNSQLIPDYWPGILFEAKAYNNVTANILREDNLGPSTLILLFDSQLSSLKISQPPEAIHFGFEMDIANIISKRMRYVEIDKKFYPTPPDTQTPVSGSLAPVSYTLKPVPLRAPNVIQLNKLAQSMMVQLEIKETSKFTAAEFALELVTGVTSAEFNLPSQLK